MLQNFWVRSRCFPYPVQCTVTVCPLHSVDDARVGRACHHGSQWCLTSAVFCVLQRCVVWISPNYDAVYSIQYIDKGIYKVHVKYVCAAEQQLIDEQVY